ncbi:MAG: Glycerophosphodiester phosphodiesterase [Acetothermia bacterium 64_32]|nr:MAG: Glycerophosphodiester phosphodiesterase [Acetothermia bacterium 64_32]
MKVIAHRGGGAEALENSAAALRRAISLGVDGVEVDIWPTRDEGFVVLHDADIARLTGRPGWTSYLTLAEIQALRIGGPIRRKLLGERALSLRQALQVGAGRGELLLELKLTRHSTTAFQWIEERLVQILREQGALDWTLVISFDHRSLLRLREVDPQVRIGMLYAGEWLTLWDEVRHLSPQAILPHWAQTTPELVREAHGRGLEVYPWVVNQPDLIVQMGEMKADGLITDRPAKVLELLGRRQSRSFRKGLEV